jgi:hypothetical protein
MAKSKFIALVCLLSAFSATLQVFIAPITFQITGLPFGHDLIVFFPILLSVWIVRKFGAATAVGILSYLIVLFISPGLFFTIGFALGSFILDLLFFIIRHNVSFEKKNIFAVSLSTVLSFYVAGFIIGLVLTSGSISTSLLYWGPLHTAGSVVGLIVSYPILAALERTGVRKSYGT